MEPWRETAAKMFPELEPAIKEAENPYMLWFELRDAFADAYKDTKINESLVRRIYQYGHWCETQPRGQTAEDDLSTAVCVCFYEHIPEYPNAWNDMPRWFSLQEFERMENLWIYSFKKEGYLQLRHFFRDNKNKFHPGLRHFPGKLK